MCSSGDESAMTHAMLEGEERSTPARIRDAALACFAERGVAATTVRQVAQRAGVSAALVIHHFGTKERLRSACDRRVAALVRERKTEVVRSGPGLDAMAALRDRPGDPPLLRYLARTLSEGTPPVSALVDELVDDAERYVREGMERGVLRRSDDPRGVAAVLTLWSLGALVLHEHVDRVLGIDITGPGEAHASNPAYVGPAAEILTNGLLMPHWLDATGTAQAPTGEAPPGPAASEEEP